MYILQRQRQLTAYKMKLTALPWALSFVAKKTWGKMRESKTRKAYGRYPYLLGGTAST